MDTEKDNDHVTFTFFFLFVIEKYICLRNINGKRTKGGNKFEWKEINSKKEKKMFKKYFVTARKANDWIEIFSFVVEKFMNTSIF